MRNQNRLGAVQHKFLVGFRDEPTTLDALMHKVGVTARRLARWLRRGYFRDAVRGVTAEISRISRLDFALLVRQTTSKLSKMVAGNVDYKLEEIQLYLGILEIDRRQRRGGRSAFKRAREEPFDPLKLIHPNVSMEQAEKLFAEMRRVNEKHALETKATPPAKAGGPPLSQPDRPL